MKFEKKHWFNLKYVILAIIPAIIFFYSCRQAGNEANGQIIKRDTTINSITATNEMTFDSLSMEKFISEMHLHDSLAKRLRNFYNGRNYHFAWFFNDGMADYASTFYQVYKDYMNYSQDTALKSAPLELLYDSINNRNFNYDPKDSIVLKTELLLTSQFFRYSRRAYQGRNQLDAKELDWFIPRKRIDPTALLDSLLENKGKNLSSYEPVNRQYNLLKDYLLKYYDIEKNGGLPIIEKTRNSFKLNDSAIAIKNIKRVLFLLGDLSAIDSSSIFDRELENAVKSFAKRNGMKEDGIINSSFIKELNEPIHDRVQQILINMERIRWVPKQPTTDYLLVNIPEFKLHVYGSGEYSFNMNVVVGTTVNNTVIFSGMMKQIVFSPYWNVPPSILRKEIIPAIAKNKNYLARHNMEWYNGGVRQKPGPSNSLGLVKFLFPNNYNIYLHDTPAKNLFNEDKRSFSHGCIRISEPKHLAEFLLRNDPKWDSVKITKAMHAGKEHYYSLKEPIPVFIGYFTAWVDREGKLNFRDDIYGHDKKMKERLFTN